ncbi:MAG: hypothetical protein E7355_05395 [Clostridiales bacterium]|nr:hypothetical protein [Clostridiales bacterium]
MYQSIVFLSAIFITALALLLFYKRSDKAFGLFLKIFTVAFCAVGFFRFMLSDAFLYIINGGLFLNKYYETTDYLQLVLRWGYYLNYAVLPMAVFFKSRLFKNLAAYICLPFSILSAVFFNDYMVYFLSPLGLGLHLTRGFRYAYFIIELVMAISIPLLFQIREKHLFNVKDKWEWIRFFIALPFVAFIMMPVYAPQAILGYAQETLQAFEPFHIIWLVCLFIGIMALYYLFRFRSAQDRYMLCVFLTVVLFFHYDSLYLMGFTIKRLPVQLCNIASYFYLIAIPFRLKKMFHFCFLANIVGALIAILAPDFSTGSFGFWNIHYIFEHSLVIAIPALVMGLRIFPRLERKSILYTWIGFSCYFVFVFVIGTLLNGYGHSVNYFYMFDLEMAFEYFPFITFTENYHYVFGRFEVYPLIICFIYVGFFLLCLLFYALVKLFYKLEDDHLQLRLSSITLYEELTGKKSIRPKEFIE